MIKKYFLLVGFLFICLFCLRAYAGSKISVGEAFEIAYKDASAHGIDLKTYICEIYVNATYHEMFEAPSSFVSEDHMKLLKRLKGKNFAAIEFMEKRIPGKPHNDIVTTYYIDLDTGKIIEKDRAI